METPIKSKLKLNKQFSEELIIAYNFQWCFFLLEKILTSLQEHLKTLLSILIQILSTLVSLFSSCKR